METVKNSIDDITYYNSIFPQKSLENIIRHKDEARPFLYEALEKAVEERDDLEEDYGLHFYALFLFGEFRDKEAFPKIMELVMQPSEVLDYLIGDLVTADLPDILYNTYNGNLELLKQAVWDEGTDDYAKSAVLEVMGQLYLDHILAEEDWKKFAREIVYDENTIGDVVYMELADVICRCHMRELLPEIRHLYQRGLIDEAAIGDYSDCVDEMFWYRESDQDICKKSVNTIQTLKHWAMFEDNKEGSAAKADLDKLLKEMKREANSAGKKIKIGRNDPCFCGSGKKYKLCCMNKPKTELDMVESEQERIKYLKKYPELTAQKQEGRIYLDDFYDAESIEIDKLLYLGLRKRPHFPGLSNWQEDDNRRKRLYLWNAFLKFREKAEREGIKTFEEYDAKYFIHYQCHEWFGVLLELLKKNKDSDKCKEVRNMQQSMLK